MDSEIEFYVRIILLLFKGGTLVCRGIVDRELKEVSFEQILQTQEPHLKGKLLKSQYFMLYPRNGKSNPQDFDLSLLTVVLLTVLNIPRHERLEVENIKEIRNRVIHGNEGKVSLDQGTYVNMKIRLKGALTKLSASLDPGLQTACSEMFDQFLSRPFDERTAVQYVHEIRNDDELLQRIHEMLEEQITSICQMIKESENRITTKFQKKMDEQEKVLDGIIRTVKGYHEDKGSTNNSTEEGATKGPPHCEKCFENNNTTAAKYLCYTCNQYICLECYESTHVKSLLLSMKNHHLQNAEVTGDSRVDMKDMDVCSAHSGYFTHYCKQHKALCCHKCIRELHENCQRVVEINTVAESSANYMLNPVAEVERLHESTTSMKCWMVSFEKKLNEHIENIPTRLQEERKKMIDLFDKKAGVLTNKAIEFQQERLRQIQTNRSQCKDLIHNTEQTKRSLIRIATTGTPVQRFIAYERLSSQIETFENDFSLIKSMYKASPDLEDFKIFEEIAQDLGPLSLNVPNVDNDC